MLLKYRLDKQYTWRQYWNYLRRQLYVLDTYVTPHNRLVSTFCFQITV